MIFFQVTLLVLIALGLDGSFKSPEFEYEKGEEVAPPFCREASVEERIADSFGPQGKASTFNIWGYYRCEHNIFEYGERNSFFDFIANNAGRRADEVALKIAKLSEVNSSSHVSSANANAPLMSIHVEVMSDVPPVAMQLRSVFQAALVQHAPKVKILRLSGSEASAKLRVIVRRIDNAEQFIGVSLLKENGKEQEWIEL